MQNDPAKVQTTELPVEELILDYDFDGLPYTYCPGTDDVCCDDTCITFKQCHGAPNCASGQNLNSDQF